MADEPYRVPIEGQRTWYEVGRHLEQPIIVRVYEDGTVRVEHRCDRSKGTRPDVQPQFVTQAPALAGVGPISPTPEGKVHRISWGDPPGYPPTVGGSVQCLDCDLHGMIEAGVWRKV